MLYEVCRSSVGIFDGWIPIPSTVISYVCNVTLYHARKELKNLKEEGLIKSDRYIEYDEGLPIIHNGYTITAKAKTTEEYRTAFEEERRICLEAFGIDIAETKDDTFKGLLGEDEKA